MRLGRQQGGFTLIEVMIAVGIIGILASLAIPTFYRYKYRIRYSEATQNLSALYKGQAALFNDIHLSSDNVVGHHAYVTCTCPFTVAGPIALRTPQATPFMPGPNHYSDGCDLLGIHFEDPIYFSYHVIWGKKGWVYWNYAFEDLDGDGDIGSYLELVGIRDGELFRAGRYSYGDRDTILQIAFESQLSPDIPMGPAGY